MKGTAATKAKSSSRLMTWLQAVPFIFMHVACLAVFLPFIHATALALTLFAVTYAIRVFGLTAGFHRYFAHRSFKTSRVFQFVLAWMGTSALQRGPIWWAGHHRHHHRHSDDELDVHSPIMDTIWQSHIGWIFDEDWAHTPWHDMRDFANYPELRFLEKHHWVPGISLAVLCFLIGGWDGLVWGFFVSTVAVYHVTFFVNSLCHLWGTRRYKTTDFSRNNALVALLTFGEGWHNNHHYYQSSANQGFRWYEFDLSYAILRLLSWFGIVWDLRKPPKDKLPAHADASLPKLRVELAKPVAEPQPTSAIPTLAAQQVTIETGDVEAAAATLRSAVQAASEMLHTAVQAAAERISSAVQGASTVTLAAPTLLSAAQTAAESVRQAAQNASESILAAAQAASERVSTAAHHAAESVALAAHAARPAVVTAAVAAVPVAMAAQNLAQNS
jgi:stearoyl-CoA desaturase (delta-9 desaturase)